MNQKLLLIMFLSLPFIGCQKEVAGELKQLLEIQSFVTSMEEEPPIGKLIGRLYSSTNFGEVRYKITSSGDYFRVDSVTGDLYVLDASYFDFEERKVVKGYFKVIAQESKEERTGSITVNLLDGTDSYVTAFNVIEDIDEFADSNDYIGRVTATTNKGTLTYKLLDQTPENAIRVSEGQGALYVLDPDAFNYSIRKYIVGNIRVSNGIKYRDVTFRISLNDVKTVQERLDDGETPYSIYNSNIKLYDSLWGKEYKGGYLIYYNTIDKKGIVAAKEDLPKTQWGCEGSYLGASYKYLTTGDYNTSVIFNKCFGSLTAASRCAIYYKDGFDDWYLPSIDELNLIHEKLYLEGIGNLKSGDYWSSSEQSASMAYRQFFNLVKKNQSTTLKRFSFNVRPVRKFED